MAKDLRESNDINTDTVEDVSNDTNPDFGNDIASDAGVDLNDSDNISKNKLGYRIAAGMGALSAGAAGVIADTPNDYCPPQDDVPAHYAVLDSQIQTPQDIVREMAGDIHDVAEADADERKRSAEIKENTTVFPQEGNSRS